MKRLIIIVCFITVSVGGTCQQYDLSDFHTYNSQLAQKVDSIFQTINDTVKVGQMIVAAAGRLGKSDKVIRDLTSKNLLGGVILLNGSKSGFIEKRQLLNKWNNGLPLIYSADAEPTLIGRKITGTQKVKQSNEMLSREEVLHYTKIICDDLKQIGITYNYAPVVDMSPNKTISTRSFGNNPDTAQAWANIFIKETQNNGIVATAKHFPGHGYVKGDTHKQLVKISGELREIENYIPLIKGGVLSIMIAHIAIDKNIKYNTKGFPSSCSRSIVTGLLKNELSFNGIVITDAMNMGGVINIENCELEAAKAGCDMILMPVNEEKAVNDILNEMSKNGLFQQQIYASVKKIIRLKICLGLI